MFSPMFVSIWSPEFEAAATVLLPWGFAVVALFVVFAKFTESHQCAHLGCGIVLIVFGVMTLEVALMNKVLMSILFDANSLSVEAKELGDYRWSVVQVAVPALSFSLGTRFVGNWVTARRPSHKGG